MSILSDLSNEISSAASVAASTVVTVLGRPRIPSSGIVWKPGLVVTSDAGLRREEEIKVILPDGATVPATLKGRDGSTDLAVLACDTGSIAAATFSESPAKLGELVLTVGRTMDTGPIVTLGVVSGTSAEWRTWRGAKLDEFVRLDVELYPTSVGGAVVDSKGAVLGIVAGGLSRSSVLVITRRTIDRVAEALSSRGRIARGYIGIGVQTVAIPAAVKQQLNLEQDTGIMTLSVEENGPAARAGIMMGDVIVTLGSHAMSSPEALHAILDPSSVGKQLNASVLRGGSLQQLTVTVGERPVKNAA
ncbi:MAG TPA: S1C family serine protease [Bryobacteraceae bacterium]|jgi:S1-C subfamily serine protease